VLLRALDKEGKPDRDGRIASLGPESLRQVGFEREEALLPVAETSFQGYRLMQEYFSFPQKYLFFDLSGLDQMPREVSTERFEVVMLLEGLEQNDRALLLESAVNADTFQLGCTPAINLFKHGAEPIRLSHTRTEYAVVPDVYVPLGYEVYSVDGVIAEGSTQEKPKEYRPFYSLRHGSEETAGERNEAFWFSSRGPSTRNKELESDVFLSFVDRGFNLSNTANESITVKVTCSNRDLPTRLRTNV
jgi:type VI secretion system protein ImpG